jgi:hypothetical protein
LPEHATAVSSVFTQTFNGGVWTPASQPAWVYWKDQEADRVNGLTGNLGSRNFDYIGTTYQTFTASTAGVYQFEVWGAKGGNSGGNGGYAKGRQTLTTGQVVYVYVGDMGKASVNATTAAAGGWNGGSPSAGTEGDANNGGGGGATDIRTENGSWDSANGLSSRLIVAGGGGGAVGAPDSTPCYGGGLVGGAGISAYDKFRGTAGGGTQTAGGIWNGGDASMGQNGFFGKGGAGKRSG